MGLVSERAAADAAPAVMNPRTRRLLQDPILPLLLRLAWPNILIMLAQASSGLIETWWVSQLGTAALAGMALVFPGVMLMGMISGGAMGGGISSAMARALGAGRKADADALVLHSAAINMALGLAFSGLMLGFGRPLYRAMGGSGAALDAAMIYSNIVFGGNALLWLMNALASVIRGTGTMLVPALVTCAGVVLLVPLSPLLIFGIGPFPALGVAGGGVALVAFYAGGAAILAWYILAGRSLARFGWVRLQWRLSADILRVGTVAALSSLQTNVTIAAFTSFVAGMAGIDAVAGFGAASRLEYLLVPLVFGLGAPLVALVGTNIGAGQRERALRAALTGGVVAFILAECIGLAAASWPQAWLTLFTTSPDAIQIGSLYLRIVGPCFGFFGLGIALYFAAQGAGRLFWPLVSGSLRLTVAVAGGTLALKAGGTPAWLFALAALGLVLYGIVLLVAVMRGAWLPATSRIGPAGQAPAGTTRNFSPVALRWISAKISGRSRSDSAIDCV